MSDKIITRPYKPLPAMALQHIRDQALRRLTIEIKRARPEEKDLSWLEDLLNPSLMTVIAEEVVKALPAILLGSWESGIITPEDIRKRRK